MPRRCDWPLVQNAARVLLVPPSDWRRLRRLLAAPHCARFALPREKADGPASRYRLLRGVRTSICDRSQRVILSDVAGPVRLGLSLGGIGGAALSAAAAAASAASLGALRTRSL